MGLNDFKSLSMDLWSLHLSQLGHSQNSMWFSWHLVKNCLSLLRMTDVWIWYRWDLVSNIFLAAWMELVMTITLEMFALLQAWLILHLIVKSSASVLVTKAVWWTILTKDWSHMWICETEVAMLFLMLALETTIAVCGDMEDWIIISFSWWEHNDSFFALLAKLKEIWSGKILIILESRLNSRLRGEKDRKTLYSLLFESMRCSFTEIFWWSVSVLIKWGGGLYCVLRGSSMRVLMRWFSGRVAEQSWDLLASLYRWSFMGMSPAIALSSSVGNVLNAPSI